MRERVQKITLSVIKADVGSIGGHTKPSDRMLSVVSNELSTQCGEILLLRDYMVTHTGDDIALIMSHEKGVGNKDIHQLAWKCFEMATKAAQDDGLYGAGQDLLVNAPSGNIRGAGPAVAEIEFDLLPHYRKAEAFMIFTADKCAPGAYNFPLWNTFCNVIKNTGLLLSPVLNQGFKMVILDMDHKSKTHDKKITIDIPEESWDAAALLMDTDRFAVESIYSRAYPEEKIVSVSATRLHNIAGTYTGKDDPVMIMRTQGIFPAPEEAVAPYQDTPYVSGDCRGSHIMTLMPMAINSQVSGEFCQPIVSAIACSMNKNGRFSNAWADIFGGCEWNTARQEAVQKSTAIRRQGPFGPSMASRTELAYTGLTSIMARLNGKFILYEQG
ncbi:MAG: fructose 1,6-bisphosphatase [Candidatus Lloydbacteria bacterium CG22_combo_CG10-13_8_21_14_all_47_15]|uniref:Fructose-1,6-bisphosphate aldolase/phosphatase n=1 Tax=Candidatus Lloydbacteria bacterium CG22_combo_CG10-13_8_21_14_all_47_15 TaxID=1974635 RepID=A0A2H0CVE0_9BACT|nr:MAG: fructose 1,6-bisphosphatase [Candidatus Lloydbacteria bacterium CG22_combo_CG10-13_8_21_14_all_47_15]